MNHNFKRNLTSKITMAVIAFFAMASFTLSSCTKKDSGGTEAAKFIGTWNGSTTCVGAGTGGSTVTIGGSGNNLTLPGNVGSGACFKNITANGTASGNTFNFPTQSFTDNCGVVATLSVSGTLSGTTLTIVTNGSVAGVSATCTFTGHK